MDAYDGNGINMEHGRLYEVKENKFDLSRFDVIIWWADVQFAERIVEAKKKKNKTFFFLIDRKSK